MHEAIETEFAEAKESISWANEAIAEFDALARAFFQPETAIRIVECDPATGENTLKVRLVRPIPRALRRKATEALITLRHSFDQAAFAARNVTSGRSSKSVYYPWATGPKDLEGRLERSSIDVRLWDVFAKHEPYPTSDNHAGGDNLIRSLATLANKKHTVGLSVTGAASRWSGGNYLMGYVDRFALMTPKWDPARNEIELIRWKGDLEIGGDQTVFFEILLHDARLPERTVAKTALEAFAAKAQSVVESLQAHCLKLVA